MKTKILILLPVLTLASLAAPLMPALSAPATKANASDGADLFRLRCKVCHSVEPGARSPLGPNLAGVLGRKVASGEFNYSPALKASNLTWDKGNLDKYLTSPGKFVQGTRMMVSVGNKDERTAIIEFLASGNQ